MKYLPIGMAWDDGTITWSKSNIRKLAKKWPTDRRVVVLPMPDTPPRKRKPRRSKKR